MSIEEEIGIIETLYYQIIYVKSKDFSQPGSNIFHRTFVKSDDSSKLTVMSGTFQSFNYFY